MARLTPAQLPMVAQRFKALGEPARLALLNELRQGPRTVSDLMEATGLTQANASRHLKLLMTLGFLSRERDGHHVYYQLADREVLALCDIMCKRIRRDARNLAGRIGG